MSSKIFMLFFLQSKRTFLMKTFQDFSPYCTVLGTKRARSKRQFQCKMQTV